MVKNDSYNINKNTPPIGGLGASALRVLLEKFYHGETSPAEESLLAEYFDETNHQDIPEDLAKEAEVFRSLNSLLTEADQIVIPEDFESKLAEIMNVVPEKIGSRRFRIAPFILKAASIAAAACLIWGLITFISGSAGFQPADQGELTAVAIVEKTGYKPVLPDHETIGKIIDKEETKTDNKTLTKNITPQRIAKSKPKAQSQPANVPSDFVAGQSEDCFIEITDPEEARQIMENIGNLLAANFSESDKAISTVSASIESYKEITKTILQ